MNLGTRLKGRPRNRWQDEVREDGRIVGGEGWQEKVHNREERKKLLRMTWNHPILHMSTERMNEKDEDSSLLGCKPVSVVPDILRKNYHLNL